MADADLVTSRLAECAQTGDFAGAVRFMRENVEAVTHELNAAGVKDALKKATKDRLLLSFADGVEFGERPIAESLVRIEKLMAFQPGAFVLSKSLEWGLGVVKKLDYFYRRVTVDFRMKKGHQFTYAAAVDMLTMADADQPRNPALRSRPLRDDAKGSSRRVREANAQEFRSHGGAEA